jgi:hypothetical protein
MREANVVTGHAGEVVVAGIRKPSDDQMAKALQGDGLPELKGQAFQLLLPQGHLDPLHAGLVKLMDAAADGRRPLMPRTFFAAAKQRFTSADEPVEVGDTELRGTDQAPGDSSDPRARVLIPEEYDFAGLGVQVAEILPPGGERSTDRDLKGPSAKSVRTKSPEPPGGDAKPARAKSTRCCCPPES